MNTQINSFVHPIKTIYNKNRYEILSDAYKHKPITILYKPTLKTTFEDYINVVFEILNESNHTNICKINYKQ
jgi:hypothetical protein